MSEPEDLVIRIHPLDDNHFGYCEACGYFVTQNDDEISFCPQRYLTDHSDQFRSIVRKQIKAKRPRTKSELTAIQDKQRKQWDIGGART